MTDGLTVEEMLDQRIRDFEAFKAKVDKAENGSLATLLKEYQTLAQATNGDLGKAGIHGLKVGPHVSVGVGPDRRTSRPSPTNLEQLREGVPRDLDKLKKQRKLRAPRDK